MDIIKALLKVFLFISVVLAIGQIPLGDKVLGNHFVTKIGEGSQKLGREIKDAKWFAGIKLPDFIEKWLEKPASSKRRASLDQESQEAITQMDREAMLQILKE